MHKSDIVKKNYEKYMWICNMYWRAPPLRMPTLLYNNKPKIVQHRNSNMRQYLLYYTIYNRIPWVVMKEFGVRFPMIRPGCLWDYYSRELAMFERKRISIW